MHFLNALPLDPQWLNDLRTFTEPRIYLETHMGTKIHFKIYKNMYSKHFYLLRCNEFFFIYYIEFLSAQIIGSGIIGQVFEHCRRIFSSIFSFIYRSCCIGLELADPSPSMTAYAFANKAKYP